MMNFDEIFWKTSLMIKLKVIKTQDFTFSLENTISGKPQRRSNWLSPPAFLGLNKAIFFDQNTWFLTDVLAITQNTFHNPYKAA